MAAARPPLPLDLVVASLEDIVDALSRGAVTSVQLVDAYLGMLTISNLVQHS
jgi:hypothetical protein